LIQLVDFVRHFLVFFQEDGAQEFEVLEHLPSYFFVTWTVDHELMGYQTMSLWDRWRAFVSSDYSLLVEPQKCVD
jgi:hypothetical protein